MSSIYDKIYDDILNIKDSIELLELYFNNPDFNTKINNIDFRIKLIKVLKFLDEDYTFNRIFYYIIKKLLYAEKYDLINKILNIYELKYTDIDKLINEIKIQEDELSFKNFKYKILSNKQNNIIEFLESIKKLM
jgi:hypothetical protein